MLEAVAAAAEVPAADRAPGVLPVRAACPRPPGSPSRAAPPRSRRSRREVGRPVRPMLASPAESLDAALAELGPEVSVEYKLDGARIQVHRDGDAVRVWTRTLREVTDRVPELVELVRGLPVPPRRARRRDPRAAGRRPPAPVPGDREPLRGRQPRAAARPFFFDCLHLDGADLIDEPLSARLDGAGAGGRARTGCRACCARRRSEAAALLEQALAAGPRGRDGQGPRRPVRRGPARAGVAEGETGAHAGPRGARRRVGVRPAHGHAVQHPSRRAGPGRRRTDHGRQDVQGHDGRAAGLADGDVPARTRASSGGTRCCCAPSWWWRSSWTACSAAPATRAASRCASPGSSATGPTRPRRRPTRSMRSGRCCRPCAGGGITS